MKKKESDSCQIPLVKTHNTATSKQF